MAVDLDKIEQQLATMIEELKPFTEGSEANNVLARMQSQVVPAFIRWKASEQNRQSGENEMLNAFVCLVSSQLVSLVVEVVGDPPPLLHNTHFDLANSLLLGLGEEIGAIMTGAREMQAYHVPTEHTH